MEFLFLAREATFECGTRVIFELYAAEFAGVSASFSPNKKPVLKRFTLMAEDSIQNPEECNSIFL
jgi:hypothetical protein